MVQVVSDNLNINITGDEDLDPSRTFYNSTINYILKYGSRCWRRLRYAPSN